MLRLLQKKVKRCNQSALRRYRQPGLKVNKTVVHQRGEECQIKINKYLYQPIIALLRSLTRNVRKAEEAPPSFQGSLLLSKFPARRAKEILRSRPIISTLLRTHIKLTSAFRSLLFLFFSSLVGLYISLHHNRGSI